MSPLPGVSGSLFPSRFLSHAIRPFTGPAGADQERVRRRFLTWWRRVEATCGPATGLRALFDFVAMPLAGLLEYRGHDAEFRSNAAAVRLEGAGARSLQMLVLPWATRPSRRWNDLDLPRPGASDWSIVLAPPFLSVVHTRGHAFRRSLDFRFPDAIDARSFPALWMVCHPGNLLTSSGDQLLSEAGRFQDAVREDLQAGVVQALGGLAPVVGRRRIDNPGDAPFGEALTIVYRILFLLFAESRALAPTPGGPYGATYAMTSLCHDAAAGAPRRNGLWDGMAALTRLSRSGCATPDFAGQPFNGRLFSRSAAPSLETRSAARPTRRSARQDEALAGALVALATRPGTGGREEISYADLGVEQLGAVYERVLDLDSGTIAAAGARAAERGSHRSHSRRRKESGTFYTPRPLAEFVVRRTLAPLVHGATADDILALRVVDPAMGSGAFLVAACRFLSDAYERALVDEGRCAETDLDADSRAEIRRLIASRCLAGVDANPVAVQLARLSLWLTTLARDRPLSFFDHQLRCGDSLVGSSPDDLWRLSRPDRAVRAAAPLFEAAGLESAVRSIASPWRQLRHGRDDTVGDVRERERLWGQIAGDRSPLAPWRRACDLWCARWFQNGRAAPSPPELRAMLDALTNGDRALAHLSGGGPIEAWSAGAEAIARDRGFFHWPLEFADLFYDDDGAPKRRAGFHAVIGNPPWEMVRGGDPARRELVSFIRGSGLFPSCDRGHLNLYQPFLERSLSLVRPGGRVGLVLPWGAAVDEGTASLRRRLFQHDRVETIVGLDNSAGLFPIHRGVRFLVMVASPGMAPRSTSAVFGVRTADELDALPGRDDPEAPARFPIRLTADTLRVAGGASLRIPDTRHAGDLEWLVAQCRRFPPLGHESGWRISFGRELNATDDRESFGDRGLPVIEGKHIGPFTVDAASTRRRIPEDRAARLLPAAPFNRARLAYRDVAGAGNRMTLIAAIVPAGVVTTHTLFCLRTAMCDEQQHFLCALFNSAPLNRIVRMLMGGHVTTGLVEHLPAPVWTGDDGQIRLADLARTLAGLRAADAVARTRVRQEIDERVTRVYS